MGAENGAIALVEHSGIARMDAPITGGEIETLYRLAKGLAMSGFFKDARQAEQAFAKLVFGRDLGLSATQAMTDIHIIDGKPEMSANLQAAKVRASERYDYRVLEHDLTKCSIEIGEGKAPKRDETGQWLPWPESLGVSTFTMEDAKRAKLDGKANWKSYPKNMLFARALSNGVAFHCPDVMNGIRVYAEGEIAEVASTTAVSGGGGAVDAMPVDEGDRHLTGEEVKAFTELVEAAGIDDNRLSLLLASVGVDCTEDLSVIQAQEIRHQIDGSIGAQS